MGGGWRQGWKVHDAFDDAFACDGDQDEDRDNDQSHIDTTDDPHQIKSFYNLCSRVKCVSLTVVPDYIEQQPSPPSVSFNYNDDG